MRLQEGRDMRIFNYLAIFGFLKADQIASLTKSNIKIIQRRLKMMFRNGFLNRISLPSFKLGSNAFLYFLGPRAESLLNIQASRPRLNNQTSHQLRNNDIMIKVICSARNAGIECAILPEHLIRQAEQRLIPDGSFCLTRKNKSALFMLESDEGTESMISPTFNDDIENKFLSYKAAFEENSIKFYEDYFGKKFNRFRLLYVVKNRRRIESIKKLLEEKNYCFVYLTTLNLLMNQGIFADIWQIPALNKFKQKIIENKG